MLNRPTVFVILDGFGQRDNTENNAIATAHMPHIRYLMSNYPHTFLHASGSYVGLLPRMTGNSLAGHTTIGAGRIIQQPITLLMKSIQDGSFMKHPLLLQKFSELSSAKKQLHLMGLLSDGGSHAHDAIAHALIKSAANHSIQNIVVHPFLDGRDVPICSAPLYLERLDSVCTHYKATIGSLHGRSFAMDRIKTKETAQQSFTVLTTKTTHKKRCWQSVLDEYYAEGITDEFIPPTALTPTTYVQDGDGLIFWNTRADRARLLSELFMISQHPHLSWFVTASWYGESSSQETLVPRQPLYTSLIDALSEHPAAVCCIAESEKAAHISYFLGGEREKNKNITYHILPSLPIEQLTTHPEMRAHEITSFVLQELARNSYQFYFINYANADMLGHTGNLDLTIKGLEILDKELGALYQACVLQKNGVLYITADHGNAEYMFDTQTQQIHTGHTNSPVLFLEISQSLFRNQKILPLSELAHIAPYLLAKHNIPVPLHMTSFS